MKARFIFVFIAAVSLWFNNISIADILAVYPVDDAYVKSDEPDITHDTAGLSIGYMGNSITRSYLKFNISAIPDGQTIVSAELEFDFAFISFPRPTIGAYYLENDSWTESTLTWNNAPTTFSFPPRDAREVFSDDLSWTVDVDVVAAYYDDDIYSVVMKLPSEIPGSMAIFASSEALISDWFPILTIEYQPIPEPATFVLLGLGGMMLRKK